MSSRLISQSLTHCECVGYCSSLNFSLAGLNNKYVHTSIRNSVKAFLVDNIVTVEIVQGPRLMKMSASTLVQEILLLFY